MSLSEEAIKSFDTKIKLPASAVLIVTSLLFPLVPPPLVAVMVTVTN